MTQTNPASLQTPGDREKTQAAAKDIAAAVKRGPNAAKPEETAKAKISGRPIAGCDQTLANLVDATTTLRKAIRNDKDTDPSALVSAHEAFLLAIQAAGKDLAMIIENAKLRAEIAALKLNAKA